jgi:iron complex outermembrane receptor protein
MKTPENSNRACRVGGILLLTFCALRAAPLMGQAQDQSANPPFSMEQLVNMDVSSVARRDQKLYKTPAAVYVITHDDIQRSGAESIPEVLRLVPGIEVAQLQANTWAVSIRGFNSVVANKLLVMIDGRCIYNIVWSSTYWDLNEIPLDIVERIEVVRGPGATMWGANAVNGVINIITMKAQKTLGTSISGSAGNASRSAGIRYGTTLGTNIWMRVHVDYQRLSALQLSDGSSANDAGRAERIGLRLDWDKGRRDSVYLHGDIFRGHEDQQEFNLELLPVQDKGSNSSGYVLGRWEHRFTGSDTALQVYYDVQNHWDVFNNGRVGSMDLDFQHHISSLLRNEVTWGVGGRVDRDHVSGQQIKMFHDKHQVMLYSSFVQDEIALEPGKVVLTAGSKFHWNTYTHFEWQPSVRLLWSPNAQHSIWAAVSRAVRTPSIRDRDLNLDMATGFEGSIPIVSDLLGNPDFKSEDAISYEAGYRQKIGRNLSADLAGYFTHYTQLESIVPGTPSLVVSPNIEVLVPTKFTNQAKANSQGVESTLLWNPKPPLHLRGSYTWLQGRLASTSSNSSPENNWATPRHAVIATGAWDFARRWSFDAALYADSKPRFEYLTLTTPIDAYQRVDASVAYTLAEELKLRVGVRNMQAARHFEFTPLETFINSFAVPRAVYAKFEWRF